MGLAMGFDNPAGFGRTVHLAGQSEKDGTTSCVGWRGAAYQERGAGGVKNAETPLCAAVIRSGRGESKRAEAGPADESGMTFLRIAIPL
jgi:hypothetical protein